MPGSQKLIIDSIRRVLERYQYKRIYARELAEELPFTAHQIGLALAKVESEGHEAFEVSKGRERCMLWEFSDVQSEPTVELSVFKGDEVETVEVGPNDEYEIEDAESVVVEGLIKNAK